MMQTAFLKYKLNFKQAAGTSRGVMLDRDVWYLFVRENDRWGVGEIAPLRKLSCDDRPDLEKKLSVVCERIHEYKHWIDEGLIEFPSIRFGLETAIRDLQSGGNRILFPSEFTKGEKGIPINGLIWMGKAVFMKEQIRRKIELDFRCIKLKIGAIDFESELELIKMIRQDFNADELEIRVDANGAFSPEKAPQKLDRLAEYHIHSIEQPIRQGQWKEMAKLCKNTPVPIALDEELIGINVAVEKQEMLQEIKPQYIILKPSLHGGFTGSREWIDLAEKMKIKWWITSALESNIGLNAIAQWTFQLGNDLPQGLGTGQLFSNNFPSPLEIKNAVLYYTPFFKWDLQQIRPKAFPGD